MASNKATHSGTCQICGRSQKLPSGALSKHGYTTKWGFFEGTCPGSGYLPFELSIDRISRNIALVQDQISNLKDQITETVSAPVTDTAPFYAFDSARSKIYAPGFYETTARVYEDYNGKWLAIKVRPFNQNLEKIEPATRYSLYGSVEEIVKSLRLKRAERLAKEIDNRRRYIKWQEERTAGWVPCPEKLIPVSTPTTQEHSK